MTNHKARIGRITAITTTTILALAMTACEEEKTTTATSTTKTTAPVIEEAPLILGMALNFADDKADVVEAADFGPHIVDGQDHQRGIIDRSNWRIVAQCDQMKNGRVKVGAVKNEEHWIIVNGGQGSTIANNELQGLLECP